MTKRALYLAGGGARGAYQAGVLKAIDRILQVKKIPFDMLSGVSIGSINAAILAQDSDDFSAGVEKIEHLWRNIHCQQIFETSNYELGKSFVRSLGHAFVKKRHAGHLLDTTPLLHFIETNINFDKIQAHVHNGLLETFEVISNCYETQQTISFYQHFEGNFEDWYSARHISQSTKIKREHILASSSLPLFFPTVRIDSLHYGDGSMGLVAPLRGIVKFQMSKVMILGTRPAQKMIKVQPSDVESIGFAEVLGNMLSGLFLDNLDRDIEMVNRMNEIAKMISMWKKHRSPWRSIETMEIRPSIDVAEMAQAKYPSMPRLLRVLLNMLGAQSRSGDLPSFLLFEKEFTSELVDLGYHDTLAQAEYIEDFFN